MTQFLKAPRDPQEQEIKSTVCVSGDELFLTAERSNVLGIRRVTTHTYCKRGTVLFYRFLISLSGEFPWEINARYRSNVHPKLLQKLRICPIPSWTFLLRSCYCFLDHSHRFLSFENPAPFIYCKLAVICLVSRVFSRNHRAIC